MFTLKNLQFTFIATLFAFTAVFIVLPQMTHTQPVAEACCGTDPTPTPTPTPGGGGGDHHTPVPPVCDITTTLTTAQVGQSYTVSWNGTPSNATFKMNGTVVAAHDSLTIPYDGAYDYYRYVLAGSNSDGICSREVVVYKQVTAPVCDVNLSATEVAIGGTYTITWNGTPASGTFKMNGTPVTDSGSRVFTFGGPNTESYTFSGVNGSKTCSKTVTVTKKVVTVPAPACTLTATPASVTAGNSSVLKWTSSNAVSGSIDQSVGTITLSNTAGRSVTPTATKTYTMTVVNSAGATANCTATVSVHTVTVPAPTCTLVATPASIVTGNSSQLKWTSTNSVTGTIDQGVGAVNPNNTAGVRSVAPTASKTYTLTVQNSAGVSATCAATVSVHTVTVPAPSCTLSASPSTIVNGNSSTLVWTSNNAVSGSIDQGIGGVTLSSITGQSVSPTASKTYTMTVTNSAGVTATCAAAVTVTTPTPDAPVCDYLHASPVTINRGESTTLTWATTRATSASLNNGVGGVAVDGSYTVSPLENTTYTLSVHGDGGNTSCAVPVTVVQPHNNLTCSQNVRFYADDNSITEGERTTLHWDTTGVTNVSITDLGSVSVDGSQTVAPSSDRTYNLTASNGSDSVMCPVTIDVATETHHSGGGGSTTPRCDLSVSDSTITLGERVTLKWTSSYSTDLTMKDASGKILVTTEDRLSDDKRELFNGDLTLRPEKNTTYTLVAKNSTRSKECTANVIVSGAVVVSQVRDQQPVVSGIALTQVPYTGFEAGPVMTFFFFGLLALWALYLAYVLVIRRNGEMAMVAVGTVVSDTMTPSHGLFTAVTPTPVFHQPTVAPVVETVATPVVGYEASVMTDETTLAIENHAHAAHVLLSSDALRSFVAVTTDADRMTTLDAVLTAAKGSYPTEDGWVVLGEERMNALLAAHIA